LAVKGLIEVVNSLQVTKSSKFSGLAITLYITNRIYHLCSFHVVVVIFVHSWN